jgi:hypothetical protein
MLVDGKWISKWRSCWRPYGEIHVASRAPAERIVRLLLPLSTAK